MARNDPPTRHLQIVRGRLIDSAIVFRLCTLRGANVAQPDTGQVARTAASPSNPSSRNDDDTHPRERLPRNIETTSLQAAMT